MCTDCDVVDRVVRGEHIFGDSGELGELYDLLRFMRGHFDELMCRWVLRESISFVDGLLRNTRLFRRVHDVIGSTNTDKNITTSILRKWEPYLNGDPFFSIKERRSSLRNTNNLTFLSFFIIN